MSLAHLPSYALVSFDATPIILVTEIPEKPGRDPDSKPRTYKLELQRIHQHVYKANYAPAKPGRVILQATLNGEEVKKSFKNVIAGCDPSKVKVSESAIKKGIVGISSTFFIDTKAAGTGRLFVEITGPGESPTRIHDKKDGTCHVEFVPSMPGDYILAILYGEGRKHIPGSPFTCTVDYPVDHHLLRISGLEDLNCPLGQVKKFVIDASKTAKRPIIVKSNDNQKRLVVKARKESPKVYDVSFQPAGEVGDIIPLHIFYDDKLIWKTPLYISSRTEPEAVRIVGVSGEELPHRVPASRDAVLLIDTSLAGKFSNMIIQVTGPDERRRRFELTPTATKGIDELRFRTDLPGEYTVVLRVDGVKNTERRIKVRAEAEGQPRDVRILNLPTLEDWRVGEERRVVLERLREEANSRLSLVESTGMGVEYAMESKQLLTGKWEDTIRIRPRKAAFHYIQLLYGGVHIQNGTLKFQALEEDVEKAKEKKRGRDQQVSLNEKRYFFDGAGLDPLKEANNNLNAALQPHWRSRSPSDSSPPSFLQSRSPSDSSPPSFLPSNGYTERVFSFDFDPVEIKSSKLKAVVTMPSSKPDAAEIVDNADGTVLVKYHPKQSGNHVLHIYHQGVVVQGTPISFYVDQFSDGFATIYGPGTQGGVVGEPAHFTVCAKHGHAKELSVSIEGPAQANIKIHDNKDGTCAVSWVPPVPGQYKVHVKLAGKELHESPFIVAVAGSGSKRAHMSVGSTSEVALNIAESELKGISASIKSPSGIEEPCFVRIIEGGRLGVSFTPREPGEHLITVKRNGKLVPKAPFKIKVDRSQVGDASRVEVTGDGRGKAETLKWNEILVDTTKAGYGGLSVSVQGPSKAELQCKEKKAGLVLVSYKPLEPGVYAIAIKFADNHVKSSPFTVHCLGQGKGSVIEEIKKSNDQAPISLPNQDVHLYLKLANTSPMNMVTFNVGRIMDPRGNSEDVELRDQGSCFYDIKFRPKVDGAHLLSILHKDAHINGSPFQFTVGTFPEGGAHRVRASGMGVVRGETTLPQFFNLYTREAGPGQISVTMEGPSRAAIKFVEHKDGNCHIEYKVATPGEYSIHAKFNGEHIPDSPFKVFIAPATGEARKLELASFHDSGLPVNKAFTFTVLTHRARGHLEAKVLNPDGQTDTIDIVPIEEGESYALRFVPKESGNHYIHVTLDGAPMRDSPFRLRVGGRDESDPTAIMASGEGLMGGQTGQKCEFFVKTSNAGTGIMHIQIDGPSKVTLDAYELDQGYKARYTPLAPGDYYAVVKYNGIHIPGSPFKIKIEGKVLGGNGYNETAMVKIDAVAKTSKGTVAVVPVYKGDPSKVTVKGAGLNKFFPGRPATFSIDTGIAGSNILLVGVVTSKGPCDECVVRHQGNGHYVVTYRIQERVKGFIFIKYGEEEIPGSPFALEY